ncbi:MAG: hypothetical protein P8X39_12990 [Desulfofustis sp.]
MVQNEKAAIPILSEEQAEKLPTEPMQSDDIPLLNEESEKTLDELQQKGSALVISAAEWIDSFFDDPRYVNEENRSRAKLKLTFGYSRFDDFEFSPGIDLRLNLPVLENRVNLFLKANDDDDFDADSNPVSDSENNKDEDLTLGIKYFLAMGERYNVSTDVGVSGSYVYGGLRYRHLPIIQTMAGRTKHPMISNAIWVSVFLSATPSPASFRRRPTACRSRPYRSFTRFSVSSAPCSTMPESTSTPHLNSR